MRAMWKGAVSFGLVNVPVKMYTATTSHDVAFHQVHKSDGGRIRYKRVCSVCGEEVDFADIGKGYESMDGQARHPHRRGPRRACRSAAAARSRSSASCRPSRSTRCCSRRAYYLEPDKTGVKPYALLREALREADRMALVHIAIRSRSTLAVLRVRDDVIVLQTMLWPDEIRAAEFDDLGDTDDLRPQEPADGGVTRRVDDRRLRPRGVRRRLPRRGRGAAGGQGSPAATSPTCRASASPRAAARSST
ncbi:hypothetical protein GCM10025868_29910 [Angustibacter aerolatus]|uniref:Ku domain-containing protein n=1 Tax=Angustibacter aerolatus TaxID=1162965 RepID=A0ABQ6JLV7_9ACTN|nr:Ku protein [Angustibacter aerolatus]GMA87741.1 hypothetical protein GCM10025868_29910 [Angustibacter aerolatus]